MAQRLEWVPGGKSGQLWMLGGATVWRILRWRECPGKAWIAHLGAPARAGVTCCFPSLRAAAEWVEANASRP